MLGGKVIIFQSEHYRASSDSVLLAAFAAHILRAGFVKAAANCQGGKKFAIAELGVGTGAVMLCLLTHMRQICAQYHHKMPDYTGFDINPSFLALAEKSLAENHFSAKLHAGNITGFSEKSCFDAVVMNPPFFSHDSDAGLPRHPERTEALYQGSVPLPEWIGKAAQMLRPGGRLLMIHQTERLHEIIKTLSPQFGAITLCPLYPFAGKPAKRILLSCQYRSRAASQILPGIVLHQANGSYSDEADAILNGDMPNLSLALP